jgi:3'-phosphoadenosine 5'-phosphosulfate sulfotransferase (PAPS reductase)/FAD synthetase
MIETEKKHQLSLMRVRTALRTVPLEQCVVACSFGKDSMAVLDLVRQVEPNIKVVWSNTGVEYPQNLRYSKEIIESWGLNIEILRPPKGCTFWTVAEEHGLPTIRRFGNKGKPNNVHCCEELKEKPAKNYYKEHNIKLIFTGIRAEESRNRTMLLKRCGDFYLAKRDGRYRAHIIADWTEEDVWIYHHLRNIPVNPTYTELKIVDGRVPRVGCFPCTAYTSWEKTVKANNPKLYDKLIKMKARQDGNSMIEDYIDVDENEE